MIIRKSPELLAGLWRTFDTECFFYFNAREIKKKKQIHIERMEKTILEKKEKNSLINNITTARVDDFRLFPFPRITRK